jgi:hypothetical protein
MATAPELQGTTQDKRAAFQIVNRLKVEVKTTLRVSTE